MSGRYGGQNERQRQVVGADDGAERVAVHTVLHRLPLGDRQRQPCRGRSSDFLISAVRSPSQTWPSSGCAMR